MRKWRSISACSCLLATLLAGRSPAESLSYLAVADYELANGGHAVVYIGQKRQKIKDLDTLPYIPDV
jgi:hypothetical protein